MRHRREGRKMGLIWYPMNSKPPMQIILYASGKIRSFITILDLVIMFPGLDNTNHWQKKFEIHFTSKSFPFQSHFQIGHGWTDYWIKCSNRPLLEEVPWSRLPCLILGTREASIEFNSIFHAKSDWLYNWNGRDTDLSYCAFFNDVLAALSKREQANSSK